MFLTILIFVAVGLAMALFATGYYRGEGKRITWLNEESSAKSVGDVVVLAVRCLGICVVNIAGGAEGEVDIWGRFNLPATAADTWQVGEQLYWDVSTGKLTNAATTHIRAGMAANKKYALADTADVLLNLNVD